jgi:type II secretion system protein G
MVPRTKSGFTLIELLVVVAIVGLLATIAVISISSASKRARDTKRRADLKTMQKALDIYFQENGAYPSTGGAWWGTCATYGSHDYGGPTGYIPNIAPTYLGQLPRDPKPMAHPELAAGCTAGESSYLYMSNGTDYKLLSYCNIESGPPSINDPMIDPVRPSFALMVCNPLGAGCAW